jgi:hypothetical protein
VRLSRRGGRGSGAKAFVRGVVGERMYGFSNVIEAGLGAMEDGVEAMLWPYIAVTGRMDGLLMMEQSPSILMGNVPRVGWCS